MKDKSQIEDMRAAMRGDIERARARREADPWRAQEPVQESEPEPAEESLEEVAADASTVSEGLTPAGSVPAETVGEPVDEVVKPAPAVEVETPEPEVEPEVEPETKRSGFLSRLFGRG